MLFEEFAGIIDEECGVVGVSGHKEASNLTYLALHSLQHRGQESVGVTSRNGDVLSTRRRMGKVSEVFGTAELDALPGSAAVGHVRYSTTGDSSVRNAQPVYVELKFGPVALAHNGNLTNADQIRKRLENNGSIFHTTNDTEVIAHLMARSIASTAEEALVDALRQVEGAYSLVALTKDAMIAVRDPAGVRPLSLGKLDDAWMVVSETCSLDLVRAAHIRDIEPGEFLVIKPDGTTESSHPFERRAPAPCIFELVYFSRPDSTVFGRNVYETRVEMGRVLARENPIEADIVIPVPDSGVPAAIGYAKESGIPFELGLIRSHYVGRTFIEPTSSIRHFGVKLKLNPVASIIRGRRVVVIDDSIVRGTTCRKIVELLREAGAKEVHFRVASPPTMWSCFYGINTPKRDQLIAATHTLQQIAEYIHADSVQYLTIEGLREAAGSSREGGAFCEACFSGDYPVGRIDPG